VCAIGPLRALATILARRVINDLSVSRYEPGERWCRFHVVIFAVIATLFATLVVHELICSCCDIDEGFCRCNQVVRATTTSAQQALEYKVVDPQGGPRGKITFDFRGNLRIAGPNMTSGAITIDGRDFVGIGNIPQQSRLYVEDDAQIAGYLRVGVQDAFGSAPYDPDGCIALGRKTSRQAQTMIRLYRQKKECARIGLDGYDRLALMRGAVDWPALVVRDDGGIEVYGTVWARDFRRF
jgi:hypothetical protein